MKKAKEARRLDALKRDSESHQSRNIAKRYKLPEAAVTIIEKAGAVYGQQSRAIQVALELLWTSPGWGVSDESMTRILNSPLIGKTYKLPPQAVGHIENLHHEYGTRGNVLAAVAYILEANPSGKRQDLRERLTKIPVPPPEKIISYEPVPPLKKGETWAQRAERETAELSKKR